MARDRRPGRGFHERANDLLTIDVSEACPRSTGTSKRYKEFGTRAPHPDAAGPTMKRLAETVLKVAALLAIDRGGSEIVVDDLASATALAERWKRTTLALLADLGRTRFRRGATPSSERSAPVRTASDRRASTAPTVTSTSANSRT